MFARLAIALAAPCIALSAHAHAFLEQAQPRVGSVVQAAPAEVRLRFNEALEPAFSSIQVLDANGKAVDARRAKVDDANHAVLRLALPRLAPGAYVVKWRAVSVDTHATEGRYVFTVRP
jgi:hypothetical protein